MPLLLALIRDLDVLLNARLEINIFTLKCADATQMALMLQQLFVGTGARCGATAAGGGAVPGGGVVPGGGAAAGAQQRAPITITIQQTTPEAADHRPTRHRAPVGCAAPAGRQGATPPL